ncbi:PIN domain-containing protein [Flexivirga caeni]|uniref:PIN domain-containing protein n=1 Tax=Flexivirga caeni TaxID=2294115 RepID=UPI0013153F23|nr:PIN domain-containing protein [Flexivirga caeni]
MTPVALGVLDTSVVIDPPVDVSRYARLVGVAAITMGELAYGLHVADTIELAVREGRYRAILATYDPIPYDAEAAHWFGAIAAAVRQRGRNPRSRVADLLIAATAKASGAAVLTRNPADFKGIDAIVEVIDVH